MGLLDFLGLNKDSPVSPAKSASDTSALTSDLDKNNAFVGSLAGAVPGAVNSQTEALGTIKDATGVQRDAIGGAKLSASTLLNLEHSIGAAGGPAALAKSLGISADQLSALTSQGAPASVTANRDSLSQTGNDLTTTGMKASTGALKSLADSASSLSGGAEGQKTALSQLTDLSGKLSGQDYVGKQAENYASQKALLGQLQGVANGTGPNPAQAALAQQTQANIANQAAMAAGQRGAGTNVGLMARQVGQQGAGIQQQSAGQAATMQAQQQLSAMQQMAAQQQSMAGENITGANQQASTEQAVNQGFAGLTAEQLAATQGVLNASNGMIGTGVSATKGAADVGAGQVSAATQAINSTADIAAKTTAADQTAITAGVGANTAISNMGTALGQTGATGAGVAGQIVGQYGGALAGSTGAASTAVGQDIGAATANNSTNVSGAGAAVRGVTDIVGSVAKGAGAAAAPAPAPASPQAEGGVIQSPRLETLKQEAIRHFDKTLHPQAAMGRLLFGHRRAHGHPADIPIVKFEAAGGKVPNKAQMSVGDKLMSGGHVPGKAKVKGNNYSNDVVEARLSPGEVVIPRSVMESHDPINGAAKFVAAIMAKKGRK